MTTPTPDSSGNITPGYYHAEGDPEGLVRYWDGTQWTSAPMPPPPGTMPAAAGGAFSQDRFGGVGIRIGAAVLDAIFTFIAAIAILFPLALATDSDGVTSNGVGGSFSVSGFLVGLVVMAVNVWLIRQFGGTPGKLLVGLRITDADGTTTPPSLTAAAMRVIPIAIVTSIPLLGFLAGLVVLIMCLVWVSNDAERRSPYDRIGGTRVVYTNHL